MLTKFYPKGGVSSLEFLVAVLTHGNLVDKEKDIDPLLAKFVSLDIDKDGFISAADVAMASSQRSTGAGAGAGADVESNELGSDSDSDSDSRSWLPSIVWREFLHVMSGGDGDGTGQAQGNMQGKELGRERGDSGGRLISTAHSSSI